MLHRIKALEARVAFLETEINAIRSVAPNVLKPGLDAYAAEYERKFRDIDSKYRMLNARLNKKNNNNADDRPRDQSTP